MIHDQSAALIVGAAAVNQHLDDPLLADDALTLMRRALEAAADDAGSRRLLTAADLLLVPQGTWANPAPTGVIAPWNPTVSTIVAEIGVLQQTLLNRACVLVSTGQADVVLVAGGEAKFRALRAAMAGVHLEDPVAPGKPTERMVPAHEILTREEVERGLPVPARQYAMVDTALRCHDGWTREQHVRHLADLQARASRVAESNPDAWNRQAVDPDAVANAALVAWPYTKLHCSQWNVDQAAGLIVCNSAAADRFGIAADRRVFAHVGAESNLMVPMTRRSEMHRSPAIAVSAAAVRTHCGIDPSEVDHLELYSCFPAAVRVQAREMAIDLDRPLTITGGMTFAGGPLNNATLQALVRMTHVLRDEPAATGMVTNISGMLTKFGVSVWSCTPPRTPFAAIDVTAGATSSTTVVEVEPDHHGEAEVATYTVAHDRGVATLGVVVGRTTSGTHVVASTNDSAMMQSMLDDDWCGKRIHVAGAVITT